MTTHTKLTIAAAALTGLLAGANGRASAATNSMPTPSGVSQQVQIGSRTNVAQIAGQKAIKLDGDTDKHDCKGKNDCKGKGGCSAGDNGCKGKNSCKGKGGCKSSAI
jgi:hypothetical protein